MQVILERPFQDVGDKEISDWMSIWWGCRWYASANLMLLAGLGDLVAEPRQNVFEFFNHAITPLPLIPYVLLLRPIDEANPANAGGGSAAEKRRDAGDTRTAAPASPPLFNRALLTKFTQYFQCRV